jgi:hypothetical protein
MASAHLSKQNTRAMPGTARSAAMAVHNRGARSSST